MTIYYIYCATCAANGKKYVGVSKEPTIRIKSHCGNYNETLISRAISKHGAESFGWEILDFTTSKKKAYSHLEMLWIKEQNAKHPHGYNMTDGGEAPPSRLGWKHSEETKKKKSEAMRGKAPTPQCLEAARKANSERVREPHTDEYRQNMREALKGREITWGNKISETLKGRKRSPESIEKQRQTCALRRAKAAA